MFCRIKSLPSYSNNWLLRSYLTYTQSTIVDFINTSMNIPCMHVYNRESKKADIPNRNTIPVSQINTAQQPTKQGHQNAIAGVDFSSSFSDETTVAEFEKEELVGNENLSFLSSSDDEQLLQMLESRTKQPRLNEESKDVIQDIPIPTEPCLREAHFSSPTKQLIDIIECSSPVHKRIKSEPFAAPQQARLFSTSSAKLKKLDNIYPTIQLATQRPSGMEENTPDLCIDKTGLSDIIKNVKPIVLSREQEYVLQLATKGESLFYTGSAGTGKSVLLRSIIKSLRKKHEKGKVAVTASTGLASCNIGGITLHSFAGVGLGDGTVTALMKKIRRNKKAYTRWCQVKVLIIDEVSMIDGLFFNKLDAIAKTLRKNSKPFGGIQLIVCGDFYQLPPVNKAKPTNNMNGFAAPEAEEETIFAFESTAWKAAIKRTIILKEVFRQRGDQTFIDMLNDMRNGKVNNDTLTEFRRLARKIDNPDGIEPAELFSTRYEVENANNTRLNLLKGESQVFKAIDSGTLPSEQRQTVLNNFLAPQRLFLKKNAQVMCIKNFDETLVNGSLGQVVNFMDRDTYMHYSLMKENPEATIEDIEREFQKKNEKNKLEGSDTENHQPLSLNDSIFDFLEEIPEIMEGLHNVELDVQELAFKDNKERKVAFIKTLHENSSKLKYPLVRFLLPDGFNTREVLVEPELWDIEDENENVLARRVQLPLMLAWSLSIHKSQGQTLPKVKVDLKRVFEKGQAYVALSRAVSRDGLQVLNFNKDKIMAHPKVNQFYDSLSSTEELSLNSKPQERTHLGPDRRRNIKQMMSST